LRIMLNLSKRTKRSIVGLGLLAATALTGCAPTPDWEITHPTTGKVIFKGKPLADVELSFFPEDKSFPESIRPRAKTAADGTFVIWTHAQGDGAPAGSYKVTLIHNAVATSKNTIVAKPNDLPIKYAMRDTTDVSVQIVAGNNELQAFELR
jgi:hypothetical protein